MDLMTLAAKLVLDDSSFRSGVSSAEQLGQQLSGKISSMTVAVGNIMSDLIKSGFNAVKDMVTGAVNAYADYQQLIGGVETLFKTSSDKVQKYAKESFRTTGLSANEYMETVTSFSASLLQGLKGDTDAAAELSNMAIIDMADNANKMGTQLSSIQTAYQGFAKQNYTMLDNLKLGYGGTKEEMVRLINDSGILDQKIKNLDNVSFDQIIQAIHKIQEEMGITGTTAEEAASTISGSKASLVAAWNDLLAAVGGAGSMEDMDTAVENFKKSFDDYMTNFIPTLTATVANSGTLVTAIAESIGNLPTDLLSKIGSAGLESGTEMVKGVGKITHWLIESLTNMFKSASVDPSQIAEFGAALGEFLGNTISDLVTNAPAIIDGIFAAGVSLAGSFIKGLFGGIFGGPEVEEIQKKLGKELFTIDKQTTEADAILSFMQELVKQYGEGAKETQEWKQAEETLESILGGSKDVFEQYGSNIQGAIDKLKDMNEELRKTAVLNALEKASAEEMELLTKQTLEYNKADAQYKMNESAQQTYMENIRNDIMEYAAKTAKEYWDNTHDEKGNEVGFFDQQIFDDWETIAKGSARFGDEFEKLENLNFDQLTSVVGFLQNEDLSKSVEANIQLFTEAQTKMDEAKSKMDATQKEIDATKETIETTKTAMDQTVKDLLGSSENAATGVETAGGELAGAISNVASAIGQIKVPTGLTGLSVGAPTIPVAHKAIGMDYVPYDGYPAILHKGEAVITREENAGRRRGVSIEEMENALANAIESSMGRMRIDMNGERVADFTTGRVRQNISGSEHSRIRAMGG